MARIRCFFLEPADRVGRKLRRYRGGYEGGDCSVNPMKYHNAEVPIEEGTAIWTPRTGPDRHEGPTWRTEPRDWPHEDPRWPLSCICGYLFQETDYWQLFCDILMRRVDTGEEMTWRDASPGAMQYADWNLPWYEGPDGHSLMVKTPGGDWLVDSRASNCTMPEDTEHRCWIRHGAVPDVTVDKNGRTCGAGAGSIQAGSYHGFLRNGWLEG